MSAFKLLALTAVCMFGVNAANGQNGLANSNSNYDRVKTYVNPVLPGDHPDPTVLKRGSDFYHCGSSFHFTPYLPIYHSKDLVHWKVISRVVPPAKSEGWVNDRPSAGIWQGAITYFYGSYWIYFSSNGQWFSKAETPVGPWSDPVAVKTNPITGPLGYDNSIFVDDDGKPYMLIKNGQKVNRIQALGKDGQLADTVINLDWINANLQYSWAEGPVMCKRNGYYFYFPAGDVSGGQYVMRTRELTSDSTKWERLGEFFKPVTDPRVGFRRPNHISAPIQLEDGSWWTIGQSYERYGDDDWYGMGRQSLLFPVNWEDDRPWGMAPTTSPVPKPNLPKSGIPWRSLHSDYFENSELGLHWHFLNRKAAAAYSLAERKGWIRIKPDTTRNHLVQKETDHYYSVVTKVEMNPTDNTEKGGLYLTNGNQRVNARLYTGYVNGRKIIFELDSISYQVPNSIGNVVWLKIERHEHLLKASCSKDGSTWTEVGLPINAVNLDKAQPNYNSWVGTSVGLFAEGKPADFDFFISKDAYSRMPAAGYNNYYGIKNDVVASAEKVVTNDSENGGWLMISGVEFGKISPKAIELTASCTRPGTLEIWIDDLEEGNRIASVHVSTTSKMSWKKFSNTVKKVTGQHDLFIKFSKNNSGGISLKNIRFVK